MKLLRQGMLQSAATDLWFASKSRAARGAGQHLACAHAESCETLEQPAKLSARCHQRSAMSPEQSIAGDTEARFLVLLASQACIHPSNGVTCVQV